MLTGGREACRVGMLFRKADAVGTRLASGQRTGRGGIRVPGVLAATELTSFGRMPGFR